MLKQFFDDKFHRTWLPKLWWRSCKHVQITVGTPIVIKQHFWVMRIRWTHHHGAPYSAMDGKYHCSLVHVKKIASPPVGHGAIGMVPPIRAAELEISYNCTIALLHYCKSINLQTTSGSQIIICTIYINYNIIHIIYRSYMVKILWTSSIYYITYLYGKSKQLHMHLEGDGAVAGRSCSRLGGSSSCIILRSARVPADQNVKLKCIHWWWCNLQ